MPQRKIKMHHTPLLQDNRTHGPSSRVAIMAHHRAWVTALKVLSQRGIIPMQALPEGQGMMQLERAARLAVLSWPVLLVWSCCFEEITVDDHQYLGEVGLDVLSTISSGSQGVPINSYVWSTFRVSWKLSGATTVAKMRDWLKEGDFYLGHCE
jgi:hypothetical protein